MKIACRQCAHGCVFLPVKGVETPKAERNASKLQTQKNCSARDNSKKYAGMVACFSACIAEVLKSAPLPGFDAAFFQMLSKL